LNPQLFFLGPEGSFSHLATQTLFDKGTFRAMPDFDEVFEGAENDHESFAVVPLENNTAGAVDPALDLACASTLEIRAEFHLGIHHALLGAKENEFEIDTLFAMDQPYFQCRRFLKKRLSQATWIPCKSSADSMEKALSHGKGAAAIGLADRGIEKGLHLLESDIQDRKDNFTRFAILSRHLEYKSDLKNKTMRTSMAFSLEDRPGSLLETLEIFRGGGLNMCHLESRPSPDHRWRHRFWVTLETKDEDEERLIQTSQQVEQSTPWSRFLGAYPLLTSP
jgi:chorismate mutase / prephenate dehydratase